MKNTGKVIIFIFLGLFALILIAGAIGPKKVSVKRTTIIDQPVSKVFEYATDFNHMLKWVPWVEQDPQARHTIEGQPGKPGSRWSWKGESLGKGYLEIKEIDPNKKVVSELKFIQPWESRSTDIRKFEETPQGTKVTWITESHLSYPIERIVGLFMDNMMDNNLRKGLTNLKEYSTKEANLEPVTKTIHIEGMTCNGCEKTIKKSIKDLPGVMEVSASHQEGIAKVKVDSSRFQSSDYKRAVEDLGYKMLEVK